MLLLIGVPAGNPPIGNTLNLQEYMLIQHNRSFTDSYIHVNHVRRIKKKLKGRSFWRRQDYFSLFTYINPTRRNPSTAGIKGDLVPVKPRAL